MLSLRRWYFESWFLLGGCLSIVGCGGGSAPTQADATKSDQPSATATTEANPPRGQSEPGAGALAAVDPDTPEEMDEEIAEVEFQEPDAGTPEWLIQEILKIRVEPFPEIAEDKADSTEAADAAAKALEAQKELRRERNLKIVELSTEAISKTHGTKEKERVFQAAVHHLLDARSQLALQGDRDSIDSLYDAADAFYRKMPESEVAQQAQLTLVNLTHSHANLYGATEPSWIEEFAKQTQIYAKRFPKDVGRCVGLLATAAQSCESSGMKSQAINCLTILQTQFADHPVTQQRAGTLRRLQIVGQKLELAGPTIDGNFVSIDDYAGKGVIVLFWGTGVPACHATIDALVPIAKKYEKYAVVVGVNLDTDELAVDNFLGERSLTWPQIFHPEVAKRGWAAPLAAHYGIQKVPSVWLVDPNGIVVDTDLADNAIQPKLHEMIGHYLANQKKIQPVSGQAPAE
ncbi:MAG: TlpA family protein disulfide reductase [Planctomycetaceae bacterium]|nr:TlpA family protein disulfide reductase [Planctomycetaceae bacterium]